MWPRLVILLGAAVCGTPALALQVYEKDIPTDHRAIQYWQGEAQDPVARLSREIESGRRSLEFEASQGFLLSLLERLGVSSDSQVLVFSKTSVQQARISPRTPRAIYFADDVAIGFVPRSEVIELAALDPTRGVTFYALENQKPGPARFSRPRGCLECHQGPATLGVPGVYVSSVSTSPSGRADFRLGTIVTDHRTPFEDRWGGWYVNGTLGDQGHRGNSVALDPDFTRRSSQSLPRLDISRYPSPVSDVVALMTLEHQTQMTNLLTRLLWETRIGEDTSSRVEEVVAYLLFEGEAKLRNPIQGISSFTETFPQRGPRDSKGRSLRDFELRTRLFRFPLSYMVYSEAFDALPEDVRQRVWKRIHEVLTERNESAILEIVRETKPGLPACWLMK